MKRAWNLLLAIIISPEIVVALIFVVIYTHMPWLIIALGARVSSSGGEPIKLLAWVPVAMLSFVVYEREKLLFPDTPNNKHLQQWPGYYHLLDRYWITIIMCGVCIILTVFIWALSLPLSEPLYLTIFLAAITISIVACLCFLSATIQVRRILLRGSTER
jgi:hypothetical protein